MKKVQLLLLFLPITLCAQDSTEWKLQFISTLAQYRSQLIHKTVESSYDLNGTIKRWVALEPDEEVLFDIISNSHYYYSCKGYSYNLILWRLKKEYPQCKLVPTISEDELRAIILNSELLDLISLGVLDYEYPFPIRANMEIISEMEFYNIKPKESIAEIGAGNGGFAQLLAMTGMQLNIFLNEIDKDLIQYMAYKQSLNGFGFNTNQITMVKGTKKNAMLPQKMDKIIIRNSFHHFSKKTKMLASIRSALNSGGRLFINEPLKRDDGSGACQQLMEEEEIKAFFEQNGFVLEREKRLGGDLLLEYSF